ncbi:hypothetical protein DL96DRAFT_1549547 [Flagelloscypha sp. PMI_526]|nr:hypothetical protein DL96DRAFT_1549547 [Flagelloscypha sp. PMI_526]
MSPLAAAATSKSKSSRGPSQVQPTTPPRKLRSGNSIARPPNGFFLYRAEQQKTLRQVEKDQRIISRTIGHMWKSLTAGERLHWNELAREKSDEHKTTNPGYRYVPKARKAPLVKRRVKRNGAADIERCKRMGDLRLAGKEGSDLLEAVEALGPVDDPGDASEEEGIVLTYPGESSQWLTSPPNSASDDDGHYGLSDFEPPNEPPRNFYPDVYNDMVMRYQSPPASSTVAYPCHPVYSATHVTHVVSHGYPSCGPEQSLCYVPPISPNESLTQERGVYVDPHPVYGFSSTPLSSSSLAGALHYDYRSPQNGRAREESPQ